MKAKLAIVSAVLLTSIHAPGQVYTDPVGYITVDVPNNTDRKIAVPLQTQAVWSGASTAADTNTITVAANSFTLSQFGNGTHMVEVKSGTLQGRIFTILANDTNTITVDPVGSNSIVDQGFVATDTFVVRPYWTLDTLFPNGGDIGANSNLGAPTKILFVFSNASIGINKSSAGAYFYHDGSMLPAGWYDANNLGGGTKGSKVLKPSEPLTLRNTSGAALSISLPGTVPVVPVATLVASDTQANDNIVQQPFPVDMSLVDSQLYQTGAVAPSPNLGAPVDIVFVYSTTGTGLNPSSSASYFYHDGSMLAAGWYDANNLGGGVIPSTVKTLKAGSQIVIRKKAGGSYVAVPWKAPLPY